MRAWHFLLFLFLNSPRRCEKDTIRIGKKKKKKKNENENDNKNNRYSYNGVELRNRAFYDVVSIFGPIELDINTLRSYLYHPPYVHAKTHNLSPRLFKHTPLISSSYSSSSHLSILRPQPLHPPSQPPHPHPHPSSRSAPPLPPLPLRRQQRYP